MAGVRSPRLEMKLKKIDQEKTRECLKCEKKFRSEGAGNRLCYPCVKSMKSLPTLEHRLSMGRAV